MMISVIHQAQHSVGLICGACKSLHTIAYMYVTCYLCLPLTIAGEVQGSTAYVIGANATA